MATHNMHSSHHHEFCESHLIIKAKPPKPGRHLQHQLVGLVDRQRDLGDSEFSRVLDVSPLTPAVKVNDSVSHIHDSNLCTRMLLISWI